MYINLKAIGSVTLTQLAYAVALDTHRHFGRAAAACHVTQPTLSMQLSKLERVLDATLFDRSAAPVVPTDVGRLVLDQARVVLREAAFISDIRDLAIGAVTGELRLGIIPTLAPSLLPRLIPGLARNYPDLDLIVEEGKTEEIANALRNDTLDAGIIASTIKSPSGIGAMIERPLFREPFVGYISSGHRLACKETISPADLSLDDLWLLSEGHCFRTQTIALCDERAQIRARGKDGYTIGAMFESGHLDTLIRLVESGMGMTLLPALAAQDLSGDTRRRFVRPFVDPAPSRLVRMVKRRAHLKEHLINAVVATLIPEIPDEYVLTE